MQHVDFLIAGGGGAGLGLACALLDSPLRDCSILVVDRDAKQKDDRTWCFWGGPEAPFTDIARHSWQKLVVRSERMERVFDLSREAPPGWQYWMVRGIDFYNHARQKISQAGNAHFIQGEVEQIEDGADFTRVTVNGETLTAGWVFDSIIRPGDVRLDPARHHNLKQHFLGWEIETAAPSFDPQRATLFDFSVAQEAGLRFFYILPLSTNRALVEFTIFSASTLQEDAYAAALRDFLGDRLNAGEYRVLSTEKGVIPMTDYPFTRQAGRRIMNIGTKGGLVKPSTGYAFQRMQLDAQAIVASLVRDGNPFHGKGSPARYRFYDTLLLQILYRQGRRMKPIFSTLFARNPLIRVFRFLDEEASFWQDLLLIASLPPGPFLRALFRVKVLRRI